MPKIIINVTNSAIANIHFALLSTILGSVMMINVPVIKLAQDAPTLDTLATKTAVHPIVRKSMMCAFHCSDKKIVISKEHNAYKAAILVDGD
jgi:hypothetical protein